MCISFTRRYAWSVSYFSLLFCRGFTEYQNIFASTDQCSEMIADKRVQGVKFTGSTAGGCMVAELCGRHMKKGHFELGGNDPFIVLKDADIQKAALCGYKSRMAANA